MNLNENDLVANKYLIDFDLNDGCVEITSEKVSPSECETYVKKLCMKDDGNDYIFIPTDEELNLVNVSWESVGIFDNYSLYAWLVLDFSNSFSTNRVKEFLCRALEKKIPISVEVGIKSNDVEIDFTINESYSTLLEVMTNHYMKCLESKYNLDNQKMDLPNISNEELSILLELIKEDKNDEQLFFESEVAEKEDLVEGYATAWMKYHQTSIDLTMKDNDGYSEMGTFKANIEGLREALYELNNLQDEFTEEQFEKRVKTYITKN